MTHRRCRELPNRRAARAHRIFTDLAQPWVIGYHRNMFMREFWRYVDVDPEERKRRIGFVQNE